MAVRVTVFMKHLWQVKTVQKLFFGYALIFQLYNSEFILANQKLIHQLSRIAKLSLKLS